MQESDGNGTLLNCCLACLTDDASLGMPTGLDVEHSTLRGVALAGELHSVSALLQLGSDNPVISRREAMGSQGAENIGAVPIELVKVRLSALAQTDPSIGVDHLHSELRRSHRRVVANQEDQASNDQRRD